LAHRIGDGRDVHDLWHRRFVAAGTGRIGRSPVERPGTPLLTGAQSPVPEVGERRIAGLERLELEAIDRRGVEALAVPPAYQAFDARPRLPRRPRQAPGKELVVFGLEPLQLSCELRKAPPGFLGSVRHGIKKLGRGGL